MLVGRRTNLPLNSFRSFWIPFRFRGSTSRCESTNDWHLVCIMIMPACFLLPCRESVHSWRPSRKLWFGSEHVLDPFHRVKDIVVAIAVRISIWELSIHLPQWTWRLTGHQSRWVRMDRDQPTRKQHNVSWNASPFRSSGNLQTCSRYQISCWHSPAFPWWCT